MKPWYWLVVSSAILVCGGVWLFVSGFRYDWLSWVLIGLLVLNGGLMVWVLLRRDGAPQEKTSNIEYHEFLRTLRTYLSHHQVADQRLQQYYDQLKSLIEKKEKETISLLASINLSLNEQLEMARKIQMSFMPLAPSVMERPEFHWAFWYQPAETIGGDLLDIIRVGRNGYALVVADVSGHGIPSALLTSMTKVAFINHSAWGKDPAKVCQEVNQDFLKTLRSIGFYVTAFYAFLNLEEGSLTYTSAGHMPLLYYKAKSQQIEALHTKGTILGIFPEAVFQSKKIFLDHRDKLFLFTDGVVDVQNHKGEWFGTEKMQNAIHKFASMPPKRCIESIQQEIIRFGWGEKNVDDQALLCIEFLKKTKNNHNNHDKT